MAAGNPASGPGGVAGLRNDSLTRRIRFADDQGPGPWGPPVGLTTGPRDRSRLAIALRDPLRVLPRRSPRRVAATASSLRFSPHQRWIDISAFECLWRPGVGTDRRSPEEPAKTAVEHGRLHPPRYAGAHEHRLRCPCPATPSSAFIHMQCFLVLDGQRSIDRLRRLPLHAGAFYP
jgi:hypothetical protein